MRRISLHRHILVFLIAARLAGILVVVLGTALHPLDRNTLAIFAQPIIRGAPNITRCPDSKTLLVPILCHVGILCGVSLHRHILFFLIAARLAGILVVVLGIALHPLDRDTLAVLVQPKRCYAHDVACSRIRNLR